jgi:hypothetical protein
MTQQKPHKEPGRERPDLYEDDLTDERDPSPVVIEEAAHHVVLDPERESDEPG